jgi:flagellar basal body rod protein FlgC
MTDFGLLDVAARGMSAQRTLLDIDARNVAAAQAAQPGHPYQRLVARFVAGPEARSVAGSEARFVAGPEARFVAAAASEADTFDAPDPDGEGEDDTANPIAVTSETGTGDALTELIATLDAQRAYEANASIFDIGKRLAERTLDIER